MPWVCVFHSRLVDHKLISEGSGGGGGRGARLIFGASWWASSAWAPSPFSPNARNSGGFSVRTGHCFNIQKAGGFQGSVIFYLISQFSRLISNRLAPAK